MLSYDKALRMYRSVTASRQMMARNELFNSAITYAHIRSQWGLASQEARREMEQRRKAAHNVFIDACNIMSRSMGKHQEDNTWRAELGTDRKIIGDFACFIHLFIGIEAR